ncbi:MAG: ATP-dependent Clp protease ATP-binding subunit [Bacteroidales bacterium]|nr:ATP-dependent Clp protease ATP-binding subunit [Bacteroidales bacterium]
MLKDNINLALSGTSVDYSHFTGELKRVLSYLYNVVIERFPSQTITDEHYIYAVLEFEDCVAYRTLARKCLTQALDTMKEWYTSYLAKKADEFKEGDITVMDEQLQYNMTHTMDILEDTFGDTVNSAHLLCAILRNDSKISESFKVINVALDDLMGILREDFDNSRSPDDAPIKHEKRRKTNPTPPNNTNNTRGGRDGEIERCLTDVGLLADSGEINGVLGNERIYKEIFITLSKKERNNVAIVGESGVGKTATVLNIANLIRQGKVPKPFKEKKVVLFDVIQVALASAARMPLEKCIRDITAEASKRGDYIMIIDNVHTLLEKDKMNGMDISAAVEGIMDEPSLQVICTTSNKGYNTIKAYPSISRKLHRIKMDEPSAEETTNILKFVKERYENFHEVTYSTDSLSEIVRLSGRFKEGGHLPDIAIDLMDEVGARESIKDNESDKVKECRKELEDFIKFCDNYERNTSFTDYDMRDALRKKEISLKSALNNAEKEDRLNKKPTRITPSMVRKHISFKTNVPVEDVTDNEKVRLRTLSEDIKKYVIGQDEAVDEVCRVVKRQRIGLATPNKPAVLFFGGSTGTGKTYLAKKLAEKVFGSEKSLVRLDMSEYADKTSVNKIYGSSAGYVGYDEGGILTEAIKKNGYCVLLLDEVEKADNAVHNVFLQVFDDGRLTDNKGNIVDFSNVIVIMTSNVGAAEVSARGGGIGFVTDRETLSTSIIEKSLKKKFKPEFLNRIDKVIYFNSLTDENIKNIILLEIDKVREKVENIGYKLDESLMDDAMATRIQELMKKEKDFGARPVARKVQAEIEDKITDYLINNDVKRGHVFTASELA